VNSIELAKKEKVGMMKFRCPHCSKFGITAWSKYRARPAVPSACLYCKESSVISKNLQGIFAAFYTLYLFFCLFWAFVRWDMIPIYIFFIAIIGTEILILRFALSRIWDL